ncbi:outer membrane insertion C- signal [Algoriphagus halophytocola]|uniref:Outer membrane insertion C- signal n=1 Tax=Algoriphagus halophytocola TaxID=2991499 RepID=A0ABY6MF84_9BACT|nr:MULTISPECIES: outer membrane insertion C- signal [unclassified Algoriphagus]UZD21614.1 outer membrane insertion C- signal [Algoriphagus sp. TR-M5]WBL42826.1 outer membrane insertion C- signal [Algoriphagus sp. TR-M9]
MKYFKILFLVMFFACAASLESNAQEVGVRFGQFGGNNVAIDGVFSLGQFSRIHADVSFGSGVGIDALWDFIYRPVGSSDFKWYVGAGPSLYIDDPFSLAAAGEVGIEYAFEEVPIVIGADWRPTFRIVENTDFFADVFGLNIRWRFGNDGSSSIN